MGADVVEIVHKTGYLRGRSAAQLGELIKAGAAHAGVDTMPEHESEVAGLASLVDQAADGDVVAVMTHQDREAVDAWLIEHGATRDGPADRGPRSAAPPLTPESARAFHPMAIATAVWRLPLRSPPRPVTDCSRTAQESLGRSAS